MEKEYRLHPNVPRLFNRKKDLVNVIIGLADHPGHIKRHLL
jgi:hypothetical protein